MTIPPPPHTQARSTKTFKVPVLDGSVTLPEIYDWQHDNSPNHRVFVYTREDNTTRMILWPEVVRAIHTGAKIILGLNGVQSGDVVAILSAADTISYFTLMMSIMRANCIVFPISPRNSPAAVAHLFGKVWVKHVFIGREQAMVDLTNHALEILQQNSDATIGVPTFSPMPLFEDLFLGRDATGINARELPYDRKPTDGALYLHSSGSTAFPKPVLFTHHRLIEGALLPWFGEQDLTDRLLSAAVVPMYHGLGMVLLGYTASCGMVFTTFEPKSPAQLPTSDHLFHSAQVSKSDIVFCVPSFAEAWSRKPEYVQWLATRSGIIYGGGPLNKQVGDYLTSQGVSIFNLYGLTEGGVMSQILPAKSDYDWDYFKIPDLVRVEMIPQGDDTFEAVVLENRYSRPSVFNTKIDGIEGYATSDLMIPHPTKAGYWKIHGRADDQLMHSTGEKTNPGPLEGLMNQDSHVLSSVMFGRGRFQAGILIDPKPEFRFDPSDVDALAGFRNKIWPTVEKMNQYAPQHSRLFKGMILVAKPSKPFTYTAKNTPRRQAIINDYEDEMSELYNAVEESNQISILPPAQWDSMSTSQFVRAVVQQVLGGTPPEDSDDLFGHGCDSLQATWIRNTLLRALRESAEFDTHRTTDNFVYTHPTISGLASFISAWAAGDYGDTSGLTKVEEMEALVRKYSADLPKPTAVGEKPVAEKDVVVLTGTTGAVGSQTLVSLVGDEKVGHIYAVNRKNQQESLKDRQRSVFVERGLSVEVLESDKVSLVEVDFTAPYFGLDSELYKKMHSTTTHIIHNAWRVDFNLALTSFESNLRILRKLIDFALTSQMLPSFLFVSSIGVLRNAANLPRPYQGKEVSAEVAVGGGYSESKWVGEAVLAEVAKTTALTTLVVRVGQVAGASNGAWSVKEWFPSLVQASCRMGCLPSLKEDKVISWISVEQVGKSLSELRNAGSDIYFTHLVHPRPISWQSILDLLSADLQLEIVPYQVWLQKLESLALQNLNALVLLPFFRTVKEKNVKDTEGFGMPSLDVTQAMMVSELLRDPAFKQIGEEEVKAWISYWRRLGFLG